MAASRRFLRWGLVLACTLLIGSGLYVLLRRELRVRHRIQQRFERTADYYPRLDSLADFIALQGAPLANKFNDVQSIKLVYELATKRLYFIESRRHRYHHDFCRRVLGDDSPMMVFNTRNYGTRGRDYLLANLNRYPQSNRYTLEFVSEDEISAADVDLLYDLVHDNSFIGDSLRVLLSSALLNEKHASGKLQSPTVSVDEIYASQRFQALNTGTAYGILRVVPDITKDFASVSLGDIIIVSGTPVAVPVCAGILSDMFQTPLSHISVLCHSRDIPAAAQRNIAAAVPKDLIGKPIALQITEERLSFSPATQSQVASYVASKLRNRSAIRLAGNLERSAMIRLDKGTDESDEAIGTKAAGVARLNRIAREQHSFLVPEGAFAIPFYWYARHMQDDAIQHALEAALSVRGTTDLPAALKNLRDAIRSKPLDPALRQAVVHAILDGKAGNSYRFRSSSNAEDLEGFSGAGLYESKTGIIDNPEKSIDDAIRKVWASTWNAEAFLERESYGIEQRSVLMGVLCHRNFPDEAINGVAITRHLYRKNFPGFTVNAQIGETSVVSPPPGVSCEQLIMIPGERFSPLSPEVCRDYISYSSLTQGKPVLSEPQSRQLLRALKDVKDDYYNEMPKSAKSPGYDELALDIEFKFEKDGRLYLKQVRPYR